MKSKRSFAAATMLALLISCVRPGAEPVEPELAPCRVPPFPVLPPPAQIVHVTIDTIPGVFIDTESIAELAAWINAVNDWRVAVENCPGIEVAP